MRKRVLYVSALTLVFTPVGAGAVGLGMIPPPYGAESDHGSSAGLAPTAKTLRVHNRLVFLGCVYSYHECEHLAHDRGFDNHFTRHDHATCHHGPSYARFGQ
ncbi:hypothetical protein [Methylobacterium organophilum]|uniref:C2H2-type domain-containing protein n=1 Tax=Methylobacterium organophilum TaxID=410 RepID=A0ABQ4TFJ5_METOR|nr:hypothetical protein [Methylobacterium organophilum]GJE29831.1 hypothetical protein LKMONMHP_4717 [Methylobacterium organophilum]